MHSLNETDGYFFFFFAAVFFFAGAFFAAVFFFATAIDTSLGYISPKEGLLRRRSVRANPPNRDFRL